MIQVKRYNDKIIINFDEEKHRFYINGESVLGVTTFLSVINKPALIPWAVKTTINYFSDRVDELLAGKIKLDELNANEILYGAKKAHEDIKDIAAETGKAIHKWVDQFVKKEKPEMPTDPAILNGVNAFLKWKSENKVKIFDSEKIIYSKKYHYGGIIDILAEVNGQLCVCDIKTSNAIYDEMRLQVAAYMQAEQEESKKKYDGRWIIRLSKSDTPEFETHFLDFDKDAFKKDFDAFINAVGLYRWQKSKRT